MTAPASPRWKVHVTIRGHYSGSYEFSAEEKAREDIESRRRDYGVLGASYSLQAPGGPAPSWVDPVEASRPGVFLG